jgi:hypothetical protein
MPLYSSMIYYNSLTGTGERRSLALRLEELLSVPSQLAYFSISGQVRGFCSPRDLIALHGKLHYF